MSEPNGRYGDTQDRVEDGLVPGQSLADQPTVVVQPLGPDPRADTVPAVPLYPLPRPVADEVSDDPLDDIADWEPDTTTRPDYRDAPVVVRRADTLAGLLLLLAGIAAGVSLLVVWVEGGDTGLDLVSRGLGDLWGRTSWEAPAVVFGGAALFVVGLLMYAPARSHRFLGVLALLLALGVGAAVLVPLADADWDLQRWAVGGWFTAAVAGLGLLGALKALMTHPRRR